MTPPPDAQRKWTSLAAGLAGILVPLLGVALWGWSFFELMYMYWMETLVLVVVNLLKLNLAQGQTTQAEYDRMTKVSYNNYTPTLADWNNRAYVKKLYRQSSLFFLFIYFVFIVVIVGVVATRDWPEVAANMRVLFFGDLEFNLGLGVVVVMQAFDYWFVYRGRGEYRHTTLAQLGQPTSPRMIILHVSIIFGTFAYFGIQRELPQYAGYSVPAMAAVFSVIRLLGLLWAFFYRKKEEPAA